MSRTVCPLQWRHNEHDGVSNYQPHDCLLSCLFRRRSKKTSKLRVTGLCAGNSPMTGEFPAQKDSNAENVSIWWRHHATRPDANVSNRINDRWVYHQNITTAKNSYRHPEVFIFKTIANLHNWNLSLIRQRWKFTGIMSKSYKHTVTHLKWYINRYLGIYCIWLKYIPHL